MQLLSLIIAGELMLGLLFALPLHQSQIAFATRSHSNPSELAQAADAPAVSSDSTSPSDAQTPASDSGSAASPDSDTSPSGTTDTGTINMSPEQEQSPESGGGSAPLQEQPGIEIQPGEAPSLENPQPENISPENPAQQTAPDENASLENQNNPAVIEQLSPEASDQTISPNETLPAEETAQIQESSSFTNPETISPRIIEKADVEESSLAAAASPQEEAAMLIQFADEKVNEVASSLQANDFGSSEYLLQRMNTQVDDALTTIGSMAPEESVSLKQQIADFAQKAEPEFRAAQLTVPEGMEQDFEIARAKFLNIGEELK